MSNNDSCIQRCNMRATRCANPSSLESEHEIGKTNEVGSIIGYDMVGKETEVSAIIVEVTDGDEGFLAIHGEWINLKTFCLLVVVYAPQDLANKSRLWNKIHNMVECCNSLCIVLRDFNEEYYYRLVLRRIKEAVWNCGGEKAPGPDGFTFKFIKFYWDTVGNDFIDMVKHFERNGSIPKSFNSSFIALVPKIQDSLHLNDFRPISLIGCQYKVIAKVLANRLLKVINSIVSEVQTAYIQGRQIIDGPLIVNEILAWATKKKRTPLHLKSRL
ncbi:RNA-directed DNA polymerase, eukaryota, reverse transcriptase zinc-binding domain protein [Tanacetum coccineum]